MDKTKKLAYTGIMTALVFLATYSVIIPVPLTEGYIHMGDSMVFLSAVFLGWKYGAFAAGVGSMLADIIAGYAHWALPTLIIKSIMAFIVGAALRPAGKTYKTAFAVATAAVWTLFIISMKSLLHNKLIHDTDALLSEIETAGSISQLENLAQLVQTELSIAGVLILLAVAASGLYIYRRNKKEGSFELSLFLGFTASGLWMVMSYYIAACIIYGTFAAPIFSIPMNLVQFAAGLAIAIIVYIPLKKHIQRLNLI